MQKCFRVSYTLIEEEPLTVSPHTGRPYKRPRKRRRWVHLSELVSAESLPQALEIAVQRAESKSWRLEEVKQEGGT